MRTQGDDGILHLFLPRNQYWARSMLPGIARFVRSESPLYIMNHGEDGVLRELSRGDVRPAAFLGVIQKSDKLLLRLLKRAQIPTVNISNRQPPPGLETVIHDDPAIGAMAAGHLAGLENRHFGYVGLGQTGLSAGRLTGLRGELTALGLGDEVSEFDGLPHEMEHWLAKLPLPAAVFCAADGRARALAQRAERLGISVPDQLAILGVDNDPFECDLTRIPLSSIELRFEELGYRAAQRAWALYCGEPVRKEPLLLAPSHVEIRLSTDYMAVEDPVVREALRFIRQPQPGQLTVAAVAAGIDVSRRVLEKRFRRATGRTVFTEIHESRLERARRLVEETSLPVETISDRIGLADTSRFIKLFKERFGKTPTAWRRGLA
jgi:LacI family transcriptional regulator